MVPSPAVMPRAKAAKATVRLLVMMPLDSVTHRPAKHAPRKRGVVQGEQESTDRGRQEDGECRHRVGQSSAEDLRVRLDVKAQDAAATPAASHVDQVVCAPQKLVQVARQLPAEGIFTDGGAVRGSLAV